MKNYRHGDVALIGVKSIPRKATQAKTNVFMSKGSSGHDHTFDNGYFCQLITGDNVIGYIRAKDTKLFHDEHSPNGVPIEDGAYEVRKQNEFTHEGLREVID